MKKSPFDRIAPGDTPFASFREFFKLEASGGIVLFLAAALAMLLKNSPAADLYSQALMLPMQIRIGALDLHKPLVLWVNDGLMAVFFFMVAMEIKREMLVGHLSNRASLVLPVMGAIGGMLVPACIFVALNLGDPDALQGWAIPTSTDIAFALGVLALVGPGVPISLKIFLLTLAVLDDLGAIAIIAVFYSANLSLTSLAIAGAVAVGLAALNYAGVRRVAPYVLLGVVLWVSVLKSGVHATLAGVILGFAIPLGDDSHSPLKTLIHDLHPGVAFGILPAFALFNAGIDFRAMELDRIFSSVPIGIALGLFAGKPIGILLFCWIAVKARMTALPAEINWHMMLGVAFLCGIGFTMSLFLGGLAFQEGGSGYARADRLGIVAGSLLAGLAGFTLLKLQLGRGRTTVDH